MGSPSSALSAKRPSGENVTMSGRKPLIATSISPPCALKNAMRPGLWRPVASLRSTATATRPFETATLFGKAAASWSPNSAEMLTRWTRAGLAGLERSTMSRLAFEPLTQNMRALAASKAAISALPLPSPVV